MSSVCHLDWSWWEDGGSPGGISRGDVEQYMTSQRCSIGLMSGEQEEEWIQDLLTPSSHMRDEHCYEITGRPGPTAAASGPARLPGFPSAILRKQRGKQSSFYLSSTRFLPTRLTSWVGALSSPASGMIKQQHTTFDPSLGERRKKEKNNFVPSFNDVKVNWYNCRNTRRQGKRTGNDSYYRRRQKMSYLMTIAKMYT